MADTTARERYKDGARHRQTVSADADDNGLAEALLVAKAKIVVGTALGASESIALDKTDYPMHAATAYSNAMFVFKDVVADPAQTENVEVRDVSLAYLLAGTDEDLINIANADIAGFAAAWIAARADRANFTLTKAFYLNN